MEPLSYRTLGAEASLSRRMPERVLQFGDGNFLRGFVDDFIDQMNEKANFDSSVVIVPPASTGKTGRINRQDGLYQLYLRGKLNGQVVDQRRLIRCVSRSLDVFTQWQELLDFVCGDELRFVISNTTEAGIVYDPTCRFDDCPPASFPRQADPATVAALARRKAGADPPAPVSSLPTTAPSCGTPCCATPPTGRWRRTSCAGCGRRTGSAIRWWIASSPAALPLRLPAQCRERL